MCLVCPYSGKFLFTEVSPFLSQTKRDHDIELPVSQEDLTTTQPRVDLPGGISFLQLGFTTAGLSSCATKKFLLSC